MVGVIDLYTVSHGFVSFEAVVLGYLSLFLAAFFLLFRIGASPAYVYSLLALFLSVPLGDISLRENLASPWARAAADVIYDAEASVDSLHRACRSSSRNRRSPFDEVTVGEMAKGHAELISDMGRTAAALGACDGRRDAGLAAIQTFFDDVVAKGGDGLADAAMRMGEEILAGRR